jgi:hypothetical protein
MKSNILILTVLNIISCNSIIVAQQGKDSVEKCSYHFQFTAIMQGHPTFNVPYSGQNSLSSEKRNALSVTTTM